MGFLLGLERAVLTKMVPKCSTDNTGDRRKTGNSNGIKEVPEDHSKFAERVNKNGIFNDEETGEQTNADCQADSKSNEVNIQQCLKMTLKNLNKKWHSNEKLSLVKINKASSEVITGVRYTVNFDAKDEISGKSYSTDAIILSQPWLSGDPTVVNFKCTPRASI